MWELWIEAQEIWGPYHLEDNVKCLVSIGTGILAPAPFIYHAVHIWGAIKRLATETERTAECFERDKTRLAERGRYFRLNVPQSLERIGLEESHKINEIVVATKEYLALAEVRVQVRACGKILSGKQGKSCYVLKRILAHLF